MNMMVDIAASGRFYTFRLAEELNRYALLRKFYIIYLKRRLIPFGITKDKIKSFYLLGAALSISSKLGMQIPDILFSAIFDEWVSRTIKPPQNGQWIFVGLNGFCEKSLIRAKEDGAITIVERACPHIETQLDLMNEEMQLLSDKTEKLNSFHEKMIREYEISDYIVVPSTFSANSFIEKGFSPSKIKVVPLCNELSIVMKDTAASKDEFIVLFVGYNVYRKGLIYLLEAWNELRLPKARLIIRGTMPEKFKHLIKSDNITVIDHQLSDANLVKLYHNASVFCLPSIDEGFGMVVLEAMAAGLPAIVTENVGAKDVITEGVEGFIVPIRDKEALKEKIAFYYENPDAIKEMGLAAHKKAMEYSPLNYGKRIVKLYEELSAQR